MPEYAAPVAVKVVAAATLEEHRGEPELRPVELREATEGGVDHGMILPPHLRKALTSAEFYQEPHEQHNHGHQMHTDVHEGQEEDGENDDVGVPQFQFYQPDHASGHLGTAEEPDEAAANRESLNAHDAYDPSEVAYSQPPIALSTAVQHQAHTSQVPEPQVSSSSPNYPQHPLSYKQPEDTQTTAAEKARQRRENHKEVERRRREGINEGINALVALVPGCEKNKRAILDRTVSYVRELQDRADQDRREITELRVQLEVERRRYEDLRREAESVRLHKGPQDKSPRR